MAEYSGREFWARLDNEITEAEWIHDLIDEHNQKADQRSTTALERPVSALSDADAITELIGVEAAIARRYARRAELVALLAQNRPATDDRPTDQPGAASPATDEVVVPEVLSVSEWLSHELQMAHPYSRTAVLDLIDTSLVLNGGLSSTLALLGRVGSTTCGPGSWPTCSAAARARSRTPWKPWSCPGRRG